MTTVIPWKTTKGIWLVSKQNLNDAVYLKLQIASLLKTSLRYQFQKGLYWVLAVSFRVVCINSNNLEPVCSLAIWEIV